MIEIEKSFKKEKSGQYKRGRTDIEIEFTDNNKKYYIIVECKAPDVKITQDTFNQIAKYKKGLFQLQRGFYLNLLSEGKATAFSIYNLGTTISFLANVNFLKMSRN